jgi:hypothetical protein
MATRGSGGGGRAVPGDVGMDAGIERRTSLLRRQLGVLLGAAAGLVACAILFAVLSLGSGPRAAPPDATARALCTDLTAQRYDDLYDRLAPALQSAGTAQQFAASQRQLDTLRGTATACSYAVVSASDTSAMVRFSLTRDHAAPATADVALGYADGAWRVEHYDASSF